MKWMEAKNVFMKSHEGKKIHSQAQKGNLLLSHIKKNTL